MNKVRIKICGLTRDQDVQTAVSEGADALGFVLYEPSPRAVTAEQAAQLIKHSPAFVTTVALFVNETAYFQFVLLIYYSFMVMKVQNSVVNLIAPI